MNSRMGHIVVLVAVFITATLLRLGLANYNREANDPHIQVIHYLLKHEALPEKPECSECFQPKFFYYATANMLKLLHLNQNHDADVQKIMVQIVNSLVGVTVLLIAWAFISNLSNVQDWIKMLGFALLAFNPQMIGINSQVTNDTFLIVFCVASVYCAYFVLKNENLVYFLLMVFFSFLAVITKTNGWVTVFAITLSLGVKVLFTSRFSGIRFFTIIYPFLVVGLAVSIPLSQYVRNYQRYGIPFLLNIESQPPPLLFAETYTPYAGILSIRDGFFTFKFKDLIENPITPLLDVVDKTSHRTSFWTRMYGSANSIHFENYPPSWRENSSQVSLMIYRGIFILALLPVFVTVVGIIGEIREIVRGFLRKDLEGLRNISFGLFLFLFAGYTFFCILYAFEYRTYTVVKAVFAYPAVLAFLNFFLKGSEIIFSNVKNTRWITGFIMWVSTLAFLQILDVVLLIVHLLPNRFGIYLIIESLIHMQN
jgi:hypothetical protein